MKPHISVQPKISIFCFLLLIASLLIIESCKNEKAIVVAKLINPPIPGLVPKFTNFEFDAAQGGTFSMPSGTQITIPANAITDSAGQCVKGKVNLQYREFHDAVSVLLSGIPMHYEKSGIRKNFQTAGMFDIKATQADKELFIDPKKNVSVKMASYEAGNDYNFWWLDENNQSWEFLDRRDAEINPKKEEMKRLVEKLRPSLKFPMDDNYFALNYNCILDVYYRDDYSKINNNPQKFSVNQKSKDYGLAWTSIYSRSDIIFQGNYHRAALMVWKNITDKPFPNWVNKDKYYNNCEFTRINNNIYRLAIENENGKKFTTMVEAIMPLKALFAFPPEYWKKNYDLAMSKIYEEEKRLKLEADVFRTFEVNKFGVYNYDKFLKEENKIVIAADFKYDQNINKELNDNNMIFCLTEDNKTVIKYPKNDWDKISLLPGNKIRFMTVLPGAKVAIFTAERYLKINFDSLKNKQKPEYKFTMISNTQQVKSEDDLRKILGI